MTSRPRDEAATEPEVRGDRETADSGRTLTAEPTPPAYRHERYEFLSLIGRGGMGEVHRAHDRLLLTNPRFAGAPVVPPGQPITLERRYATGGPRGRHGFSL